MAVVLDEAFLAKLEREHPEGISSHEILETFRRSDIKLSEATLRKYVQQGLLPRSVRVGKKGKHQGSQGLYPATVVRQILRIREMMAQDYTIEQIQKEILFVRGDIEELERTLAKIFDSLDDVVKDRPSGPTNRVVVQELHSAKKIAGELLEKLTAIETRLIARAELAKRAAGLDEASAEAAGARTTRRSRRVSAGAVRLTHERYGRGARDDGRGASREKRLSRSAEARMSTIKLNEDIGDAADMDVSDEMQPATEGATALAIAPPVTREQRRSRRKRAVRARTISVKRMTKRELELGRMLYPESDYQKPTARSECQEGMRPCPYVSCKYHLFLDVQTRTGAIKLNFPDIEVEDMTESCALDIADRGGTTLEEVGAIMNLTRERIRQLEVRAMAKVKALGDMEALRDFVDEGPVGKRRLPLLTAQDDAEDDGDFEAADDDDLDADVDIEAVVPVPVPVVEADADDDLTFELTVD
jgi:hypothetical protein